MENQGIGNQFLPLLTLQPERDRPVNCISTSERCVDKVIRCLDTKEADSLSALQTKLYADNVRLMKSQTLWPKFTWFCLSQIRAFLFEEGP